MEAILKILIFVIPYFNINVEVYQFKDLKIALVNLKISNLFKQSSFTCQSLTHIPIQPLLYSFPIHSSICIFTYPLIHSFYPTFYAPILIESSSIYYISVFLLVNFFFISFPVYKSKYKFVNTFKYHVFAPMGRFQLELIYLYFPPSSQLVYLCFCPVGLSLL